MKLSNMRLLVVVSVQLAFWLTLKAQAPVSLDLDSLSRSLDALLAEMDSDQIYKDVHFLSRDDYDYYRSINTPRFANEVKGVLARIDLPFERGQLAEITFVECYDWTEAYSTWFITLIDNSGNHFIYFYENNAGTEHIKLRAIKKGEDYFYRLVENLYGNGGCKEKNEDYIISGKIVGNRVVSYFSSQAYHRMDIVIFSDLLKAISN